VAVERKVRQTNGWSIRGELLSHIKAVKGATIIMVKTLGMLNSGFTC
jgi:hypothetical protein